MRYIQDMSSVIVITVCLVIERRNEERGAKKKICTNKLQP